MPCVASLIVLARVRVRRGPRSCCRPSPSAIGYRAARTSTASLAVSINAWAYHCPVTPNPSDVVSGTRCTFPSLATLRVARLSLVAAGEAARLLYRRRCATLHSPTTCRSIVTPMRVRTAIEPTARDATCSRVVSARTEARPIRSAACATWGWCGRPSGRAVNAARATARATVVVRAALYVRGLASMDTI